jgi:hypothetical protein
MTKMLNELNHPALQSRRQKQRMIFFYKVVEGQVPAMPPDLFVNYQKPKRQIGAKFDNCNYQYSDFLGDVPRGRT